MTLLVAAGLFTREPVRRSAAVDLGLKIDNLVTFGVSPELNGYTPERSQVLFQRLEDELAALPGVSSVSPASMVAALAGSNWGSPCGCRASSPGRTSTTTPASTRSAPATSRRMGIPLLADASSRDPTT